MYKISRKLQSTLKCFKKRGNKKIKLSLEIDEAKNIVEAGKKKYCRIDEEVKEAKDEYYRVRERLKKEGESLIKKEKYAEHILR